jgi:hypothetical protein
MPSSARLALSISGQQPIDGAPRVMICEPRSIIIAASAIRGSGDQLIGRLCGQLARKKCQRLLDDVASCVSIGRHAFPRPPGVVEIVGRSIVQVDVDIAMPEQIAAEARRNFLVGSTDEDAKRRIATIGDRCKMILHGASDEAITASIRLLAAASGYKLGEALKAELQDIG